MKIPKFSGKFKKQAAILMDIEPYCTLENDEIVAITYTKLPYVYGDLNVIEFLKGKTPEEIENLRKLARIDKLTNELEELKASLTK